jgi:hypothetical protein
MTRPRFPRERSLFSALLEADAETNSATASIVVRTAPVIVVIYAAYRRTTSDDIVCARRVIRLRVIRLPVVRIIVSVVIYTPITAVIAPVIVVIISIRAL